MESELQQWEHYETGKKSAFHKLCIFYKSETKFLLRLAYVNFYTQLQQKKDWKLRHSLGYVPVMDSTACVLFWVFLPVIFYFDILLL